MQLQYPQNIHSSSPYELESGSDSQFQIDGLRKKRNGVEKVYICGDHNCGRKYGTNAALYTHIKNKHKGVPPNGTVRPFQEVVRGRKGRPQQIEDKSKQRKLNPNVDDSKLEILDIMKCKDFMEFCYQLGSLGDLRDKNILIRDQEEDLQQPSNEQLQILVKQVKLSIRIYHSLLFQQSQDHKIKFELSEKLERYLMQASCFWKIEVQQEINTFLIVCLINGKQNLEALKKEILKSDEFPNFRQIVVYNEDKFFQFVHYLQNQFT